MNGRDAGGGLCGRVLERLVDEGQVHAAAPGDLALERALAEHLGSCVTCFRALTELRDAPRVAEALRAAGPPTPLPALREGFWDQLAARTTAAALAALEAPARIAPGSVERTAQSLSGPFGSARPWRGRRASSSLRGRVAMVATAVAAAAAFLVVARRQPVALSPPVSAVLPPGVVASAARAALDDEGGEAALDVADLDGAALRRLLDRLRRNAPAVLTPAGATDSSEVSDALVDDDDGRVNDEVADLDGMELRRVASSFGGTPR
jgi:hypothetical protein